MYEKDITDYTGTKNTYKCYNCNMEFKIRPQNPRNEITRCATPNCELRFSHATSGENKNFSAVYITPEDLIHHMKRKTGSKY